MACFFPSDSRTWAHFLLSTLVYLHSLPNPCWRSYVPIAASNTETRPLLACSGYQLSSDVQLLDVEPGPFLSTNICSTSRPDKLNIEEFKKNLSELFLHISNHIKWCGWGLIAKRDESLHSSHRCQIRFSQNLSGLFKIH